jgi:hypothetical protein
MHLHRYIVTTLHLPDVPYTLYLSLKKWIYCTSDKAKLNNTYIVRINVFNVYGVALTRKYLQTRNTLLLLKKKNKTEAIKSIQRVYYYQTLEIRCY